MGREALRPGWTVRVVSDQPADAIEVRRRQQIEGTSEVNSDEKTRLVGRMGGSVAAGHRRMLLSPVRQGDTYGG